ncbi:MAG: hypothetical protein E7110_05820 [Bacteroidales bacterium]|nr:hypothetical protein [Bacteroidales bacterium]
MWDKGTCKCVNKTS